MDHRDEQFHAVKGGIEDKRWASIDLPAGSRSSKMVASSRDLQRALALSGADIAQVRLRSAKRAERVPGRDLFTL